MKTQKQKNHHEPPFVLIIGGSSGIGWEIAEQITEDMLSHNKQNDNYPYILITGRENSYYGFDLHELTITSDTKKLGEDLDKLITTTANPYIDLLVYSAGFVEDNLIEDLTDEHIDLMLAVNLKAPQMLLARILRSQQELPGFIAISSIVQTIPRRKEPTYSASKAGLRMFAQSAAKNERIKKTLVVAPAGAKTPFWRDRPEKDTSTFLDPAIIARDTLQAYTTQTTKYKEIRIERLPHYHIKQIHPSLP